jgi:hypothetical protein
MVAQHLFIFGLGYSSCVIAQEAIRQGFSVCGTARSVEKHAALRALGVTPYLFDDVPPEVLAASSHVLSSVPTQEGAEDAVLERYGKQLEGGWLGYLSTTGVYGDWEGQWVDEETLCRAGNARLERRLAAEAAWARRGGHVFRLAGIYGPGRNALEDVRAGTARRIDKEGQVFSRIHVEDIAGVVLASMRRPQPEAIYNVCDDEPAPAAEVVAFACQLLGVECPPLVPFEQASLSPMAREFYSANRRVRNDKIKKELGVRLRYPTYREGLKALLAC